MFLLLCIETLLAKCKKLTKNKKKINKCEKYEKITNVNGNETFFCCTSKLKSF